MKEDIIPVCRKGVPQDWHQLISSLEKAAWTASQTRNAPMMINSIHRLLTLHWLIKLRWNSKHKVPYHTKGLKDAHKPFGEVYKSVSLIIQDCHFRQFGHSRDYAHPVEWFAGILSENAVEGSYQGNKSSGINHLQATTKKLRSYENPFDRETQPHTWKFAQTAIDSAQAHGLDIFTRELWRPFLAARSALAKHLDNSYLLSIRCKDDQPTIALPKTKGGELRFLSKISCSIRDNKNSGSGTFTMYRFQESVAFRPTRPSFDLLLDILSIKKD